MWPYLAASALAQDLVLDGPPRWTDRLEVPLGDQLVHLRGGFSFAVATDDGVEAGFVFVGEAEVELAVATAGEALALAGPLQGEVDAVRLVRDRRLAEAADLVVVLGRSEDLNDRIRALPPTLDEDHASYLDPDGREVVVVSAFRPGRARKLAAQALEDRVRSLSAVGLDPRLMIALDAFRTDPRLLAELRTPHEWRPLLRDGGDRWLSWSHDPTGAADDTWVDRWFVHDGAEVRVISGTSPGPAGFEGLNAERGAVNVIVERGAGDALRVELESVVELVAATETRLLPLAVPRAEEEVASAVRAAPPGYVLGGVWLGDVKLERIGGRFGRPPAGTWDAGTWLLPEPLPAGAHANVRVRWIDAWPTTHLLDVKSHGVEQLMARGACTTLCTCNLLVATWPEQLDLGRVVTERAVAPALPDRSGPWPAEIRVGTTLEARWQGAVGHRAELRRDAGDGRWWVAETGSDGRVSFGDLEEERSEAVAGLPAVRVLGDEALDEMPSLIRAALVFLGPALPAYPHPEVVVVQGPREPVIGRVEPLKQEVLAACPADDPSREGVQRIGAPAATPDPGGHLDTDLHPPRIGWSPGQIVVGGMVEIGAGAVGGVDSAVRKQFPHAVERGVVHALASHWWSGLGYRDRDRWIEAAAPAFYRDRFVEEAWGPEVSEPWERLRREAAADELRGDRSSPLLGTSGSRAEVLGVGLLRALEARIGERALLEGLDHFLRSGDPTTESLRDHLSAAAGLDLGDFFDAWVIAGIRPEIRGTWSLDHGTVRVELRSDLPHGRYAVPVAIVAGKGEPRVGWVDVIDGVGRAELRVRGRPDAVRIDPHGWLPLHAGPVTTAPVVPGGA